MKEMLCQDRLLPSEPTVRGLARRLYQTVARAPLLCPHTHVDARTLADDRFPSTSPTEIFLTPNHYLFRMLYSRGISLERLGLRRSNDPLSENEARSAWQTLCDNYHLFRGTPSGLWLRQELTNVFGVEDRLSGQTAQTTYDRIAECLASPDFRPRALLERFGISILCTTDYAHSPLESHAQLRASGWPVRILPTFRPDPVVNIDSPGWAAAIEALASASGQDISQYSQYIEAIRSRRAFFKTLGAVATDHSADSPYTEILSSAEAGAIFQRALKGQATPDDARRFTGHMLVQMASMSLDDGLVMQLHVGSYRNHNTQLFENYGPDMGADIPLRTEFTRNLHALLNRHGNDARLSIVIFTLDESAYSRELAPLAGHYPSLTLGPPWWFHDSPNGMTRYLDSVVDTAGIYNLAGFNDDARDLLSIPARHDMWRRVTCGWLAERVSRSIVDEDAAFDMAQELAHHLARRTYKLEEP